MFNINKISLLAFLMMVFSTSVFSQKKEIEKADSEFNDLQYNAAVEIYKNALAKFKDENVMMKQEATFKLAECYRLMNNPDKAGHYYSELINSSYDTINPLVCLRYASFLETKGDVTTAKIYYTKYLETNPGNEPAEKGVHACDWAIANQNKKAQVNISDVQVLNSVDDDFSPLFFSKNSDQIIFTSNRPESTGKSSDQWTGAQYSDLYKSTLGTSGWSSPVLFDKAGVVNTDIHEGTTAFNSDFTVMYFTRCDRIGAKKEYCKIFKTEKIGNTWSKPREVFADSTANIGQPTLSSDELTIIMSSDKKSGLGGKDLWVARRNSKDEEFGQPVVLEPGVNSAGDEMFPYLFNDTTLYFSSNGLEGYGGLDIFKSIRRGNGWAEPVNLFVPINSGYDDFGILVQVPGEEGYFSSNRPGGLGGDDIYRFTRRTLLFTLSGTVKDKTTLLPLDSVKVLLSSDDSEKGTDFTDSRGHFGFDTSFVLEDYNYDLVFIKDNYFSVKEAFSTFPYDDNHDFTIEIKLEQIPEKPIVLPDILYELGKWNLTPQYQDSLTQLVELLKVNKNLVIELRSHTDSRGTDEYNDELSQKRAQSVVEFLVTRGIEPDRLVAKGYGEKVPRIIDRTTVKEGYLFKAGTELSDRYINSLPNEQVREAAYELNRRTEFSVLSKDYKR
jgi:peptidoglycan-associated lipoprotein